jgi:hypothetical protein
MRHFLADKKSYFYSIIIKIVLDISFSNTMLEIVEAHSEKLTKQQQSSKRLPAAGFK